MFIFHVVIYLLQVLEQYWETRHLKFTLDLHLGGTYSGNVVSANGRCWNRNFNACSQYVKELLVRYLQVDQAKLTKPYFSPSSTTTVIVIVILQRHSMHGMSRRVTGTNCHVV